MTRRILMRFIAAFVVCAAAWGAPAGHAAVAVDATSSATKVGTGLLSWSHTISAATDRVLVVGVMTTGTTNVPSSVSWGGTGLTLIGSATNAQGGDTDKRTKLSVWILVAPASGTNTVAVTAVGGTAFVAGATSYTGVDQSTPYTGWTTNTGSSLTTSLTQPADTGLFVDFVGVHGPGLSVTPVSQTLRWTRNTGNQDRDSVGGSSTKTSSGTTSWTLGASKAWTVAGMWLKASSVVVILKVTHSSYGLFCLNQSITITTVNGSFTPVTGYAGTMNLSTTTGAGTWSLTSGGGTLTDSVPNDGAASYAWNPAVSSAVFQLSYTTGSAVVTVHAIDSVDNAIADDNTQGSMTFSPSGFTVTSSVLSNPPPGSIPAFASPQTAGNNFSVYITAYGQTPTDPVCGVIEAYTGAKNLKFWSTYVNPATGTKQVTIDAAAIATTEGASAAQGVTFTNGQASVTARYRDAGSLSISMKDDTTGNPSLPTGIRGTTGTFVSKPADFVVSNIKRTSDNFANPAAATASGTVFIAAGRAFTATVTAVDSAGNTTPNFGSETSPETVKFSVALVLPASGNAPAVSGTAGTFTNGVGTGTAFAWPEVGIVKLVPRISDGDFLGAGDVVGTQTGNVGRFIPDNFTVALNVPVFGTACTAGSYTYIGQPFTYTVAPVITATARALGGTTTQNYTGSLFRLTNASLTGRAYAAASGTLDSSGLPATSADPVIVDVGAGVATLTYSAGSGLAFTRGAALAPFNANISLAQNVIDLDTAAATNPVSFGSGSGISFSTSATQRYGRLALRNAVGSELLDLPMTLVAQYYVSAALGFTTHTSDSCSSAPAIALSGYQGSLGVGETCVRDTGAPGVSTAGCAAPALVGSRYRATPLAGNFNLNLAAPGAGNSGAAVVTATAPAWLKYDWNTASAGDENPSALATFGLFPGPASRIYQREIY